MKHKCSVGFFVVIALWLNTFSTANSSETQHAVVAVFGDSITVGENVSSYYFDCGAFAFGSPLLLAGRPGFGLGLTNYCNPDRNVETLLDQSERPATVVNWGIGGTLLTPFPGLFFDGLGRIQGNLNQTRSTYPGADDYIALIMYGTNDVAFGITPGAIGFNTLLLIDRARAVGWNPVIANLLPRNANNVVPANIQIQSSANQRNAPFVDQYNNFLAKGGLALHDNESGAGINERLHPSAAGYQVVAQQWFDAALESLISPIPPPPPPPPPPPVVAPIIQLLLDEPSPPPP